jgi:sulfite exporter TauE/SafE
MHQSMTATLGLGLLLGLKHAAEADHLAAISTIVSERRSIWQAAGVGALWGLGHTSALLVAGVFVLGLGFVIPDRVANFLELAVAAMIVVLGTRLLRLHVHFHKHSGRSHIHFHFKDDQHAAPQHKGLAGVRPLFIGIVHGLAGSAALTLLVLTQVVQDGGIGVGFAYLLIFGIGSIGGMLLMGALLSLPFCFGLRFFERTLFPLRLITGLLSTVFGIFYGWKILERLTL